MKTTQKGVLLGFLLTAAAVGSVPAADFGTFNNIISPGNILISGSFGLGAFYPVMLSTKDSTLLGGALAVDYALPFAALTVGGEIGFSNAPLKSSAGSDPKLSVGLIPILLRVGYHPNLDVRNLDVYILGKVGYGFGFWSGDDYEKDEATHPHGFVYGVDIGARYFFGQRFGVFAEVGYEHYYLDYEYNLGAELGKLKWSAYANKFLTLGITIKLGDNNNNRTQADDEFTYDL
ncbi:hypothetical protein AGMMS50212_01360 [Spirochaetia bacterium]|nr:hypothetical protein AGMMS50212_01360 [Spirochaetia bacterium]